MEQVCMLCRRAEADPDICGDKLDEPELCVHGFCVCFARGLCPLPSEAEGRVGFAAEDIKRAIERAAQQECFVCRESGAAITCCEMGCDRSFHLPCAAEGGCVTQYCLPFTSFCWEHRPQQEVEAAPAENETCLICLDPVEDRQTYGTMVCPVCRHAWFHRGCIQGQALRAGWLYFQCPLCRDDNTFIDEMVIMGIQIPTRLPAWETPEAYATLGERHSRCDAGQCLCAGGREQAEAEGPWQLLLCSSCAAVGTHRRCCDLEDSADSWECDSCAGPTAASSASSELAGPTNASQSGPGPSHGSPAPTSSGSQVPLELSQGFPVLEGSSCSGSAGPDRRRNRSHLNRRAPEPSSCSMKLRQRSGSPSTSSRPTRRQRRSRSPSASSRPTRRRQSSHSPVTSSQPKRRHQSSRSPSASSRPKRRRQSSRSPSASSRPKRRRQSSRSPSASSRPTRRRQSSRSPSASSQPKRRRQSSRSPSTSSRPKRRQQSSRSPSASSRPERRRQSSHSPSTSSRPRGQRQSSCSQATSSRPKRRR